MKKAGKQWEVCHGKGWELLSRLKKKKINELTVMSDDGGLTRAEIRPHFGWRKVTGDSIRNSAQYKSKGIVTLPSPSVLFNKSCLACSLEMRLLPSRNSRNFCWELRVITQRPWVPATTAALKTAIYDKKAKGKGRTESLFKAVIRACPSSDWNRIAVSLTKWEYQRFQRGLVHGSVKFACTD